LASFRAKVMKYGDRILETIESTIKEYKTDKNSSGSNDSNEIKRKRDANKDQIGNVEDDDFTKSTDQLKKRASKRQNKTIEDYSYLEPDYNQIIDDELDLYGYNFEVNASATKTVQNVGGRVLPQWSKPGNG
jgi:bloom syndrome protein